jgi:hypothetical protein
MKMNRTLVIGFAFFKCLYIHHIARYDIRINTTALPSGLQPKRLHQHQGLLFDEDNFVCIFLAMAQK